jgi:hypothetical protein
MPEIERHALHLTDTDIKDMHEALMAFVIVLRVQTGNRLLAQEVQQAADRAAKLSSRVQRHSGGLCDCPFSHGGSSS